MLWVSGGLEGGQRLTFQPGEAQTFPKRSSPKPRTPSCPAPGRAAGKEESRERRRACAQRLKSDKVCCDRKPEQDVCVCVCVCVGVLGGGKGRGSERQSSDSAGGKGFSSQVGQPLQERPRVLNSQVETRLCRSRVPLVALPS